MRTLTLDEVGFVSGGEAPCITLQTPCMGTGPKADAGDWATFSAGVAVVAGVVGKLVPQADWVSKGAAVLAFWLHQIDKEEDDSDDSDDDKEEIKKPSGR